MALVAYYDITSLTVGGTAVNGVKSIKVGEEYDFIKTDNNGITDGYVGIFPIRRQTNLEIEADDVVLRTFAADGTASTVVFTGKAQTGIVSGGTATDKTFTYTSMACVGGSRNLASKGNATFSKRFEQLSGGTIVES